jgi:predicted glycogen debranching enzyme
MVFSQNELSNFDDSIQKEWLITNGLGSYASSTILGLNTRKYSALLVAALRPPGERTVCLSKLDEDVQVNDSVYRFGANDYRHDIFPQGFRFLKEFSVAPFPIYQYKANEIEMQKTICLPYEKNVAVAFYEVSNGANTDASVKVYPIMSYRHFHYVINRRDKNVGLKQENKEKEVELTFDDPNATVITRAVEGRFTANPLWIEGLFYREEDNRGESSVDEGYQPGYFEFRAPANSKSKFAIVTAADTSKTEARKVLEEYGSGVSSVETLVNQEINRRINYLTGFYNSRQVPMNDDLNWILQAANDFMAKSIDEKRFVIAGFHWFGSWGRDTFVSLPGLMLVTGRFGEARNVILDYARYCRQGLIPNLIDDKTGEPLYNTVDGTLWFINSILQYVKYTNDFDFIKNSLWETLTGIIENHKKGTLNGIYVDDDGLLAHGPQLTWMDTIVDGAPYTPRAGKAVEVQALWYNALCTMNLLAEKFGNKNLANEYYEMSEKAKNSFNMKFWDNQQNCLFDVLGESGPDSSVRPNQVIVGALDFDLIDKEKSNKVVDFVQRELLTPVGLRTLSPKDSRYKGSYSGGRESRDRAYHSGSIWPWQTGPFVTAYLKAKGYTDSNRKYASENFIMPLFSEQIRRGGLGTLSEIYDADPPYTPRGCIAQAWSVAEPLRSYVEDVAFARPKFEKEVFSQLRLVAAH